MRAHFLQHVPFEGLGSIENWLRKQGAQTSWTRFFEDPRLPSPDDMDMVIALGGAMSVNDETPLPWLVAEKQFVRETIDRGIPILGVCLGAQLIASALGARVFPNPVKEIGWFPIHAAGAGAPAFRFPAESLVFHWHGETFDLPAGAVHLARSANCEHQAFQLSRHVIGLQFHLETTPQSAQAIVDHCRGELEPAPFVQAESEILDVPAHQYAAINLLMTRVLDYLVSERSRQVSGRLRRRS